MQKNPRWLYSKSHEGTSHSSAEKSRIDNLLLLNEVVSFVVKIGIENTSVSIPEAIVFFKIAEG